MAIKHRAVPPTIHCQTLNPKFDFATLNLDVVRAFQPINKPASESVRVGVNSFGFGGANAHIILQSGEVPQDQAADAAVAKPLPPLFLSARSDSALNELAAAYVDHIEQNEQQKHLRRCVLSHHHA